MRRAVFDRFGPPAEVIRLIDVPDPEPGPGEVRLRMQVMSINPADLLLMEGRYGARPPALPATPGAEGVGVVDAVGPGVTRLKPGDLAAPMPVDCWTEAMVVPERAVIPLPAEVDREQAAMLKANPATAEVMLTDIRALRPGDWVAQNAANSAVGRLVIAFARAKGLRTVNVVRRPGLEADLRACGADAVVVGDDPAAILAATGGARPVLAFDAVGGGATRALAAALADGGTVANYGLLSGEPCAVDAADLVFRGITLRGFWLAEWFGRAEPATVRAVYAGLVDKLRKGAIATPVEARYPLSRVAEAVAHAARPGRSGKILLTAG